MDFERSSVLPLENSAIIALKDYRFPPNVLIFCHAVLINAAFAK